jgi:hypothetical protein
VWFDDPEGGSRVTGEQLNVAEDTLDALGLRYETAGGGGFGIVVRSHWIVCEQSPPPDRVASSVVLTVARVCSVPDVVGMSLGEAEDELADQGFDVREHSLDDEPIVDESDWTVCRQSRSRLAPAPRSLDLYAAYDCSYPEGWQ